jgi:hypothetical protein
MNGEYVDITPDMMGKADPDQRWIDQELDRIDPWRHEQGADVGTDRALRKLVLELRQQLQNAPIASTGGPAFPAFEVRTHDTGDLVENASQGMTLRDYFAAKVLPAIYKETTERARLEGWPDDWRMDVAEEAYEMADEMLKARAR